MGFLDHLETLLGVDLSNLKNLKINFVNNNKDNSLVRIERVDNSKHINVAVINVGADALNAKKGHELQKLIKSAVLDEGQPLLETKAAETLKQIAATHTYDDVFEFFKDKIPADDLPILRASLYLRSVHESKGHVEGMKQDIINRYGQRGAHISNLCTAGYFENQIKDMYEELKSRPNFTPQLFRDNYNLIIDKAPFAVFVSEAKTTSELLSEVRGKIITNRMYGIHQLNIHAIGALNVDKLNELLQTAEIVQYFTSPPTIGIEGNIMNAQVFF